jgi:hypothetical protein
MKRGLLDAIRKENEECLKRAELYVESFGGGAYKVIQYRTPRGVDYGVLLNIGPKVTVWNAFSERIETMSHNEFSRLVVIDAGR